MKKILLVMIAVLLVISLFSGCSNNNQPANSNKSAGNDQTSENESDATYEPKADVEFVVPFSSGGGSDLYARIAAEIIQRNNLVNKSVVVINKPGGGGAIGDAYTFSKKGNNEVITTYVSAQITSQLINNTAVKYTDLTPICNLAMDEYTLGVLSSSYKTIEDFIESAKEREKPITVGGSGKGTEDELVVGLLSKYADIDLEYISYNSSAEVMAAMLGKHIDAGIYNPNECMTQYEAGQVNLLAAFGPERIKTFPEVRTFKEIGYEDVVFQQFRGIFGPPGMSGEAVNYWAKVFEEVTLNDQWKTTYLDENGLTSKYISGEEYKAFLDEEAKKYESILKDTGNIK